MNAAANIEVEINGQKVQVPAGSMIMRAAEMAGVFVPHFCYHKKLSLAASCRMCLVEVEKFPKPLPACATPVSPGMVIRTASDKAKAAQQHVMEFLLINHPLDCPICDQGGECQLQDLAVGYGQGASRYREDKRVVARKDIGPLIAMEEMSRCIHCTRCVRFGQEIAGAMELGMVQRGEHMELTTFNAQPVTSEISGNMIDLCPVGALTSKPFRFQARGWELSRRKSVSPHDSLGANLILQTKNDTVLRVLPFENAAVNEEWISDRDRFAYQALGSRERLTQPMIRRAGKDWEATDWHSALEYAAQGLQAVAQRGGQRRIGALAAPWSTCEELFLLTRLMRQMGAQMDTRLRQADAALHIAPWLGGAIADVSQVRTALLVGAFLRQEQPLLAARLRFAAGRGARLFNLHALADDWRMPIAAHLLARPSLWPHLLGAVAEAIATELGQNSPLAAPAQLASAAEAETARRIARALLEPAAEGEKMILLGNAALWHPQGALLHALANWIAQKSGARLGAWGDGANSVGAHLLGAEAPATGLNAQQMFAEPQQAYVLLHAEPELDCADPAQALGALRAAHHVVMLTPFVPRHADYAHVLLPVAPYTETPGTFINAEGRAQSFYAATKPLGETRPAWKVLRVLGNVLEVPGFDYESAEAVLQEALGADRSLAALQSRLQAATPPLPAAGSLTLPPPGALGANAAERLADVPLFDGDALVRRAAALRETQQAQKPMLHLSAALWQKLGLGQKTTQTPARLRVRAENGVEAAFEARLEEGLAAGTLRLAAARAETATLGAMSAHLTLEAQP